jgi:hypothetical protein
MKVSGRTHYNLPGQTDAACTRTQKPLLSTKLKVAVHLALFGLTGKISQYNELAVLKERRKARKMLIWALLPIRIRLALLPAMTGRSHSAGKIIYHRLQEPKH